MTVRPPSPPYVGPAPHTGGATNKPIRRIVMHCTAGAEPGLPGAARSTVAYTKRSGVKSSYHYVADSRESVQFVYDSVVAWHDGTNSHSIGYELSCSLSDEGEGHWGRSDHLAMLAIAAEDVARLCLAYGIPIVKLTPDQIRAGREGVCGHVDMRSAYPGSTTHWDPGPHFPWGIFLQRVKAAAERLTRTPQPDPEPNPQPGPPEPRVPDFYVGLIPSLWDAPDAAWRAAIRATMDAGSEVLLFTETTVDGRMKRVCPPGWAFARLDERPGESECSMMWDTQIRRLVSDPYPTVLAETQFYTGKGHRRPRVTSLTAALEDIKGEHKGTVDLFTALHAPSGRTLPRLEAHGEVTDAIPDAWDAGRAEYPAAGRVLGLDANRNFRLAEVRDWWEESFPALQLCWDEVGLPERGTYRDAVIDAIAVGEGRLDVVTAKVLPDVPGLDHNPTVVGIARRRA